MLGDQNDFVNNSQGRVAGGETNEGILVNLGLLLEW